MIYKSRLKIEFIEGNIRLSNLRLFIDSIDGVQKDGFSREIVPNNANLPKVPEFS